MSAPTCIACQAHPRHPGDVFCDDCGERAAIYEHESGLTRAEAEEQVRREVLIREGA